MQGGSRCFNSQPPGGGWEAESAEYLGLTLFQLTAARRRLVCKVFDVHLFRAVSTHSRPEAAGAENNAQAGLPALVSTHSRPEAAGTATPLFSATCSFQLTAARRRLGKSHS